VIVSDDASTDDTWNVCERFAAADARFFVVRQPRRLGWLGNSNALLTLALAGTDYAFFAPHDDLFEPPYVRRMVEALAAHPDAVLAFARTVSFKPNGECWTQTAEPTVAAASRLRRGLRYLLGDDVERWVPFRGVARAEALRRVGALRPSAAGEYEADGRWLFRLHLLGRFVRVEEPLCRKRQHAASLHRTWSGDRRMRIAQRAAYLREIADAELSRSERMVFRAAVAASIGAWLLPVHVRRVTLRGLGRLVR
jgi:glycosyltransferase involved in cell wall biosynthesis